MTADLGAIIALAGLMIGLFAWLRKDMRRMEERIREDMRGMDSRIREDMAGMREDMVSMDNRIREDMRGMDSRIREDMRGMEDRLTNALRQELSEVREYINTLPKETKETTGTSEQVRPGLVQRPQTKSATCSLLTKSMTQVNDLGH